MYFALVNRSSEDLIGVNLLNFVRGVDPPTVVAVSAGETHNFSASDTDFPAITRKFRAFCVSEGIPYGNPDGVKIVTASEPEE